MKHYASTLTALVCLSALAAAQHKDEPAQPKGNPPGHYLPPAGTSFALLVGGSDDCSTAALNDTIAGTGTFAVNTVGATTGAAPQPVGFTTIKNDVWFYWTAPSSGTARLETCGGATVDTKAAAWLANNGTACPSGTQVAYNDDFCALQTRISWTVTAGQTYFLQLGAYTEGVTYSGTFTLAVLVPPSNDVCSAPDTVVGNGPFNFDTTLASTGLEGQTEALCGGTGVGRDVWYSWTATFTGPAGVTTCGTTTLDTKIAVYPAAGCPTAGTALACNDDVCGTQSTAIFNCVTGTTYLIQLGQDPTNTAVGGTGTFSVIDTTPPVNDNCTSPIAIGGAGVFPFDNRLATTGTEGQAEPLCLNVSTTAIPKDSWWTWTPTQSGTVTVSTCGQVLGGTDTRLAVYNGVGCPTGPAIACNDDAGATLCSTQTLASVVTFTAVCGQSYTFQLGNYSATASLYGTFTVTETAGTPCGPPATPICFGDGSGLACPCANSGATGNGCANSLNAAGGNLSSSGAASIGGDTLVLLGSGMPNSSALYFQGTTTLNGGSGVAFGDGLRCAGGSVIRLGTKNNTSGASQYPAAGDPTVSVRGLCSAGDFRVYQVWYRNAAAFCTASTFNLTNGVSLTWTP